jgi:hypothetical protein
VASAPVTRCEHLPAALRALLIAGRQRINQYRPLREGSSFRGLVKSKTAGIPAVDLVPFGVINVRREPPPDRSRTSYPPSVEPAIHSSSAAVVVRQPADERLPENRPRCLERGRVHVWRIIWMTFKYLSESYTAVCQVAGTGFKNRLQFLCSLDRSEEAGHVRHNSQPPTIRQSAQSSRLIALVAPRSLRTPRR